MDALPTVIVKLIMSFKRDMDLLEDEPKPQYYVSPFLTDERKLITKITALCYGEIPTIMRARELLSACTDLGDFYRHSDANWYARHAIWGLTPIHPPPSCRNNLGYLVYQWLSLEGDQAEIDSLTAGLLFGRYV